MYEQEAIQRLKRGDIGGLEHLVGAHYVQAVRAAYLVCHDRALSEDIVQAAFIRAYERIAQFDPSRPFAPWFLRSVVNDAVKESRRQERHDSLDMDGSQRRWLALPSQEKSLEELSEADEKGEAVWDVIQRLTPEQRGAIVMRYYLDMSEAEMSERLHVPPGTVKSRLNSARGSMKRLLPAWLRPGQE